MINDNIYEIFKNHLIKAATDKRFVMSSKLEMLFDLSPHQVRAYLIRLENEKSHLPAIVLNDDCGPVIWHENLAKWGEIVTVVFSDYNGVELPGNETT